MTQVLALVGDATARVSAGRGDEALTLLLAAWELERHAPITSAIEALSKRLQVEPVPSSTDQQRRYLSWCERARAKRAADVGPLLDDFAQIANLERTRAHFMLGRIKALRAFPPDPRIGRFLQDLIARKAVAWGNDLVQAAKRHVDPSAKLGVGHFMADFLEAQARLAPKRDLGPELGKAASLLDAAIASAKLTPVPPFEHDTPGAESDETMLAAVYANPHDDALRQIYADRLVELADPRGEFISLQFQKVAKTISSEGLRREASLIKRHHQAWLGGLAPFVVNKSAEFTKGFVSRVQSKVRLVYQAKQAANLPEWATVREIHFEQIAFFSPAMKSLEIAIEVGDYGIHMLGELEKLPPLKGIALTPSHENTRGDVGTWRVLSVIRRLSMLKALDLTLQVNVENRLESFCEAVGRNAGPNVTDLTVYQAFAHSVLGEAGRDRLIAAALERLRQVAPQVRRVTFGRLGFENIDGRWQPTPFRRTSGASPHGST